MLQPDNKHMLYSHSIFSFSSLQLFFIKSMKKLHLYLQVWLQFGKMSLQLSFVNSYTLFFFFIGKLLRYAMMLLVLVILRNNTQAVGSYSVDQMIVFFLVFQTVDVFTQMIFREVYEFSRLIRTGSFDYELLKPINPIFRALLGNPDFNDVIYAITTLFINFFIITQLDVQITAQSIFLFCLLIINSIIISASFHIIVLTLAIFVVEIDSAVWLYRDISRLGQIPLNLHFLPVRALLYLIPIGAMITVPAEVLLGLKPSLGVLLTFIIGFLSLGTTLLIWKKALAHYTSASS